MIANTPKEKFEQAMDLIRKELEGTGLLKKAFRQTSLKSHPDRNGGDDEVFKVVDALYKAVSPFLDKNNKPSRSEYTNLAQTLRQLPEDISRTLVTKIKTENPQLAHVNLTNPVLFNIKNTYAHTASNPKEGRRHAFEVDANDFKNLKEKYQDTKGDFLKTSILSDLKQQIENTSSKEELKSLEKQIKQSPEYKVLSTGQGLATKIFGLKTSSVDALEKMFTQQEKNISKAPAPKGG